MAWERYEGDPLVINGIYNELRSGTFENEATNDGTPNNWGMLNSGEITDIYVTDVSPISDDQSMFFRIVSVGTNNGRPYLYQFYKDADNVTEPIISGNKYKLDFLVKTNYTSSTDQVQLGYVNLGGVVGINHIFTSSTAVTYSYSRVATANQNFVGLYFDGKNHTGSVIIDNVRVYRVDIPTAPSFEGPPDGTSSIGELTMELKWNTASLATDYRVIVSQNSDFSIPEVDTSTKANYYPFTGSYYTTYYWKIVPRLNLIESTDVTASVTASFTFNGANYNTYNLIPSSTFEDDSELASPDAWSLLNNIGGAIVDNYVQSEDSLDGEKSMVLEITTVGTSTIRPALYIYYDNPTGSGDINPIPGHTYKFRVRMKTLSGNATMSYIIAAHTSENVNEAIPYDEYIYEKITVSNDDTPYFEMFFDGTEEFKLLLDNFSFIDLDVTGSLPEVPYLLTPLNKETVSDLEPTFSWTNASNAASYSFSLSTDSSFSTIIDNQEVYTSGTSVTGLVAGETYYWKVYPINDSEETGSVTPYRIFYSPSAQTHQMIL